MSATKAMPVRADTPTDPLEEVGRDFGIPTIGQAPWGTHVCQFFSTKHDLLETLVPYIRAGLDDNEMCIWRTYAPLETDEAAEALSHQVPDMERRIATGQLKIMSATTWYPAGAFDSTKILSTVLPRLNDALANGFSGMRVNGSMAWLEDRDWDAFMDYEAGLNRILVGQRILGICTYSIDKCDAGHLIDVLMRHRYALVRHEDWTLIEPSESKQATAMIARMNRALAERTGELQAALTDLRGFSRWVSHDLRSPLQSVTSFAEMLTEACQDRLDDDEQHMLERIRHHAARMDRLITDILAYSMAQQSALRPERLDMAALVRETWEALTDAAQGRRASLRLGALPQAYADRAMICQVLQNLLGNAMKFTRKKTDGLVEVDAATDGNQVVYRVRDNGDGFDMANAQSLFGAFQRLHSKKQFEGTGLGLTIVKQIVARHGGRVWAEGTPGVGATFSFTLPSEPPKPA